MVHTRIEQRIEAATDAGFRGRALSEYRRVRYWTESEIDFDRAKILDFGCGQGIAAASFALRHPNAKVYGCDIEEPDVDNLRTIFEEQAGLSLPHNLDLSTVISGEQHFERNFDLIFAWSVFEHVNARAMSDILRAIRNLLRPGGLFFLQVNPLYFSPRGSHLYRYFSSPWHHLMLSIDDLRTEVLSSGNKEKAEREWAQFIELNRYSASQLTGATTAAGLKCIRQQTFVVDDVPPQRLLETYNETVLRTQEVVALFRKSSTPDLAEHIEA